MYSETSFFRAFKAFGSVGFCARATFSIEDARNLYKTLGSDIFKNPKYSKIIKKMKEDLILINFIMLLKQILVKIVFMILVQIKVILMFLLLVQIVQHHIQNFIYLEITFQNHLSKLVYMTKFQLKLVKNFQN